MALLVMCGGIAVTGGASGAAAGVPDAPRFPYAMPRNKQVRLVWTAPVRRGSRPITSYVVTPFVGAVAGRTIVFTSSATAQTISGLTNGKTYTFRVTARSAAGAGPKSVASAPVVIGAPTPPMGLAAVPGDAKATVTWDTPAQDNGAAVTGYIVTAFLKWAPVRSQSIAGTQTAGVVDGLANGVKYRFRVRAKNARGIGPPSASTTGIPAPGSDNPPPTTPPTTTTTTSPPSTNARPPAGGYFTTLPPGSALPSESTCAALVHRSSWEPRPGNATANHTVPPQPLTLGSAFDFTAPWKNNDLPRITGNFTGTTDEIMQWAACKWGWSDDIVRAQAVRESNWDQANEGDFESRSNGHCVYDDTRDSCPTSFGIIQVKWYFHPQSNASSSPQSSYPLIKRSTAFNLDLELAEMRGCYEGLSTYLGNTRGNLWGCIGTWYSGAWDPSGGSYVTGSNGVQHLLDAKEWLRW